MEQEHLNVTATPVAVNVHAQYVKDFSFENPNAPDSLRPGGQPQMDVNIVLDANKINDPENPNLFESALSLTVKSTRDDQIMFIAEISYAAVVSLQNVPEDQVKPILYIDIPQMLFPFARQIVAGAVADGGFPPLLLKPVDFRGMYQDAVKNSRNGSAAA